MRGPWRPRALLLVLALGLLAIWAARQSPPGASARATEPPPVAPVAASPAWPPAVSPLPPARNVFEYARPEASERPAARPPRVAPSPTVAAPLPPSALPATPSGPRLVGILRRGKELRAALSVAGETAVLAVGESLDGYTVVRIDEETGVRLRSAAGEEIVLVPPV